MAQLGFTFYPKDWWTSDTFYALNPFERYIYLELLFMMYVNDGCVSDDRVNVERRLGITIKDEVWVRITERLIKVDNTLTHESVNKRLRKALANRKNGLKGGRPKNPKNPKKKPKSNPPLEIESEIEIKKEKEREARAQLFYDSLVPFVDKYGKEMLREFYNYWSEWNKSRTRMKWELQNTWEVAKRLVTWAKRDKDFSKNLKNGEKTDPDDYEIRRKALEERTRQIGKQ